MTSQEIFVYASTIWGEARGEGIDGMVAVAHVIQNRAIRRGWPDTLSDVCLQPRQFSVWNPKDPNFKRVVTVDLAVSSFWTAMYVALGMLLNEFEDPTEGADHYHADTITPGWAEHMEPTIQIGSHIFYNSEE